ncbi:PIN domain-containing protein [Paraburkholderia sp. SIMBA_030]|uniref:PIN domain-containing protein n=1 Tax=Paraburkholderia sp. SIMBA_030 TaxID=3085773 RepID=UPI00397A5646
MFHVLIDTCVWLKLADDHKHTPLLQVVQGAVAQKKMKLLVPRQVLDEFKRSRARVLKASERSFTGHLQEVRKAIAKVGGDKKKTSMVLAHLAEVNHKLPKLGRPVESTLDAIEKLLIDAEIIEPTDGVMLRAAGRALNRKAPCHRENKNSIADAVILETYIEASNAKGEGNRFAFVTDNYIDFSATDGNFKLPHPDFASSFSKIRSMYFINLAECLRKIDPSFVSEVEWFAIQEEPRGISELMEAHELLFDQVWYNRHKYHAWQIERGKVKVVAEKEWNALFNADKKNHGKYTVDSVWKKGQAAALRIEKKSGKENLGPWSNFDWGMINGKLSAIRWMLGDEWDMLDS